MGPRRQGSSLLGRASQGQGMISQREASGHGHLPSPLAEKGTAG